MKKIENVPYGSCGIAQSLDIYLPEHPTQALFVYFHGGGLENGDKSIADVFAPYLTECGIAVVSANYRMYPEYSYPDFIYDAASALAWSYQFMKNELCCEKLFVGGSSAGAYLSMMLCFDKRYLESVKLNSSVISGFFHDAGQPTAHFNVLKHKGIDARRVIIDESSPLYYVGIENHYPPMRFIVSDNDMKGRYEQTMLMLSTLSDFGYDDYDHVTMQGTHCDYCERLDESGKSVFAKMILDFINKYI